MSQVSLKLDYCDYKAAYYAVTHWHYSRKMPVGKLCKIGVWENNIFVGAVIFGMGAAKALGNPIGLKLFEYCELVRVALNKHSSAVSRIVSIAIKLLKKVNPKLKAIISFADPEQKHIGIIYQAGNWVYCGKSSSSTVYELDGKKYHSRVVNPRAKQFGRKAKATIDKNIATKRKTLPKYRYVYILDKTITDQINRLRQAYPKCIASETSDTANFPVSKGGVTPTAMLQTA